jgi:hypothetical protein
MKHGPLDDGEVTALSLLIQITEALDRCALRLDPPGEAARAEARVIVALWEEAAK